MSAVRSHCPYTCILDDFKTRLCSEDSKVILRSAVDKFVCLLCHARKPQSTSTPLRPIISSGFMTRGQVR